VDVAKFEKLKNSLATGFGVENVGSVDTAEGIVLPPELADDEGEDLTDLELAIQEVDDLEAIQQRITAALTKEGLEATVRFTIDERGLTVRMVSSETFFNPDRAELTDAAQQVLNATAPELTATTRDVTVEGHTAKLPDDRYVLDWELSTARAVNVVRHLIERGGVAGTRMEASGYGESRPLNEGRTEAERELNRRVDIIVLSDQPDTVRSLIPGVVGERAL
jgi:chemotaxis protein MotB